MNRLSYVNTSRILAHTCNSGPRKAEVGGLWQVQGQFRPFSKAPPQKQKHTKIKATEESRDNLVQWQNALPNVCEAWRLIPRTTEVHIQNQASQQVEVPPINKQKTKE